MSIHVALDSDEDRVFKALASPIRRAILDSLRDGPLTTGALCARFARLDRCTVMQHLGILEVAGLVVPARTGRKRLNHLNALPIRDIYARWIAPYAGSALERLGRLRDELEG